MYNLASNLKMQKQSNATFIQSSNSAKVHKKQLPRAHSLEFTVPMPLNEPIQIQNQPIFDSTPIPRYYRQGMEKTALTISNNRLLISKLQTELASTDLGIKHTLKVLPIHLPNQLSDTQTFDYGLLQNRVADTYVLALQLKVDNLILENKTILQYDYMSTSLFTEATKIETPQSRRFTTQMYERVNEHVITRAWDLHEEAVNRMKLSSEKKLIKEEKFKLMKEKKNLTPEAQLIQLSKQVNQLTLALGKIKNKQTPKKKEIKKGKRKSTDQNSVEKNTGVTLNKKDLRKTKKSTVRKL